MSFESQKKSNLREKKYYLLADCFFLIFFSDLKSVFLNTECSLIPLIFWVPFLKKFPWAAC